MTDTTKATRRDYNAGSIFKRPGSKFWSIRFYDANGKRRTLATGTPVKAKAVDMLADELAAKKRGESPDTRHVTYEDLVTLYEQDRLVRQRRAPTQIKHLSKFFAHRRARTITGSDVTAYECARMEAGAKRATINNELAALRRMFNLAIEKRLLSRDHAPVIHTPDPHNARQGFFEAADFEAVVAELPDHLRPAVRFAYLTGWRFRSETLPLQWSRVDFAAGMVRLEPGTTKNDEGRAFPFGALPALRALLEAQRAITDETERQQGKVIPWVFHHRGGQPIEDCYHAWRSAIDRAAHQGEGSLRVLVRPQLLDRTFHDTRRTAVRNLERAGVPRSVAMKLTGHKTESVYRRYAIVAEADLREGVAKLAALGASPGITPIGSKRATA